MAMLAEAESILGEVLSVHPSPHSDCLTRVVPVTKHLQDECGAYGIGLSRLRNKKDTTHIQAYLASLLV